MPKNIIYFLALSLFFITARAQGNVYTNGVALEFGGGQGSVSAWTQPNLGGDGAIIGIAIDSNLVLMPTSYSIGIGHVVQCYARHSY